MTEHPPAPLPMKAASGPLPSEDGWSFEIKWDGMRVLASIRPEADPPVRLSSSTGKDATGRFPELAALVDATGGVPALLDGEVVVLDDQGRSDFGALQAREGPGASPARYVVFDVLEIDGSDTTATTLTERRRLLDDLLVESDLCLRSGVHDGDGEDLLDAARRRGLEGLVAKRPDSRYEPGKRSKAWRKVKIRRRQELVVGGWTPGEGNRRHTLGALLVGHHTAEGLVFAGRVGTGFSQRELARLLDELDPLSRDSTPFVDLPPAVERTAHHVEPELVVEVEYAEWTRDGVLRHPAYAGQRDDVDPGAVVREPEAR
ncbi:MAG: non-homologous end-joining DNA ligase [Actinomycetota bacterium]